MTILTEQETLQRAAARLNLTVKAQFVPFSVSRSKDQKDKNLNWRVTLQRDGRDIITTDYSAGQAHCPAYKLRNTRTDTNWPRRFDQEQRDAIARECETGRVHVISMSGHIIAKSKAIIPNECDVIQALVNDSDVLNYSCFDAWAGEFGFNTDSRQAEKIYQDCLAIALKLHAGLDEQALSELQAACQDY
jgi:hypothetical protein